MTQGKCRTCGEAIRSRRSSTGSAQANFLKAVKRHYKIKHPNTISRRISKGLKASNENPTVQDFVSALQGGVRGALKVYGDMTERQYKHMKNTMDALEPVLPLEILASWKAVEALHDHLKGED